ncbi:MAG: MBL fold metallo-hydrolase [Hyphomicrobiaceae bacterium]
MHAFKLGDYSIGRVAELEFPAFAAKEFLPAVTDEILAEARRQLPGRITDDGRVVMSFHSFVLKTGHHTILIDSCCGIDKRRPGREQFDIGKKDFLGGLAGLGVKPEEVTHVMCTHLHWDHVGWNTRLEDGQWVPTFPNARYIMAKREYDYWNTAYETSQSKSENIHLMSFEDSVLPLIRAKKAVLVADDYELDHGISLEPCHGHSPGAVVVNIASAGEKGVFVGDVLHHPMQILFPDLSCRADFDMDASRVSRKALIDKHADTGAVVMPQHFATPSCGHIRRKGEGFAFDFLRGS